MMCAACLVRRVLGPLPEGSTAVIAQTPGGHVLIKIAVPPLWGGGAAAGACSCPGKGGWTFGSLKVFGGFPEEEKGDGRDGEKIEDIFTHRN